MSQQQGMSGLPAGEPDREELQRIIAELREENLLLRKRLGNLLAEDVEIDREAILREFDKWPPFRQVIADLSAEGE